MKVGEKWKEYGGKAWAVEEIGEWSGVVNFHENCKKIGIKRIIGCEFEN